MKNEVLKAGFWYTISNFILKALAFITTPIFARILTKGEFGEYSNFATWMSILCIIVTFSFYVSINRARLDFKDDFNKYLSTILITGTIITALFYAVVVCNIQFFSNLFSMDPFYIHVLFVYLMLSPATEIFQAEQRVTYHYKMSVFISFLTTIATTVLSIVLVLLMQDGFKARVYGYIIPLVIINLCIYLYIVFRGRTLKWEYIKYAFLFCWPYVPHLLSSIILSSSDRVMIEGICGSEYTAVYTLACSCASIATVLWTSINNAVSPWVFDKLEEKNYLSIKKITLPYFLIFVLPIQLCLMVAPEILWILGGNAYVESKYLIVPLMTSVIIQFAYSLYVNVEQYSKKTWCIALGTMIAAALNIGLNFILIPKHGYSVAAYTTLIGYIALFVIHYVFVRVIGYKNIYNDKFVFLIVAASLLIEPLISWLYDYYLIRYIVFSVELIIVGVIAYVNRKEIKQILSKES